MANPASKMRSPIERARLSLVHQHHARDILANEGLGGEMHMSVTTKKMTVVLAAVFALLIAGAAVSGCDNGKPARQNVTR